MGLSGTATGGANTNLTGLSPEQIAQISQTNVAGGKLGQDSIQNIFENVQKMAYSDYLDRMPVERATKEQVGQWKNPTYNKETGTIWVIDENTGKSMNTGIVPDNEMLLKMKQGGAGANVLPYIPQVVINPQTQQPEVVSFSKRAGTIQPAVPQGQPPPISAEAVRKQEQTTKTLNEKESNELEDIRYRFAGKLKDKQGNKLGYNPQHIARFNSLSPNEFAFEMTTPGKILGKYSPNKEVKVIPKDELIKLYGLFSSVPTNKGTFEQFAANPEVISQFYNATRPEK